jgi:hypothetical protein
MTTSFDSLAKLSEQKLLDHFASLVARDRRTTAELLVAIAEIDERKLWAARACSSMFTFCMERFHMSEQVTVKRIWAARMARRFPVILGMVARGELHLGAIHLLAKHLTAENHARVHERARHRSCREVERLVAELAPRPDVPSRIRALPGAQGAGRAVEADSNGRGSSNWPSTAALAGGGSAAAAFEFRASSHEVSANTSSTDAGNQNAREHSDSTGHVSSLRMPGTSGSRTAPKPIVPLSPRRYKIEITVDEDTHDKLRSLQDLLARSDTGRDPAAIISRAIEELLVRTLGRKAAYTDRARPAKPENHSTAATPRTSTMPTKSAMPASLATQACAEPRDPMPASDVAAASRRRSSRVIPAAVRREVWRRDAGRCCYVDARGRRCRETSNVEFHHKAPFALGGLSTTANIELRCAAHNQFQADLDFGRAFMDARRGKAAAAATLRGMSA